MQIKKSFGYLINYYFSYRPVSICSIVSWVHLCFKYLSYLCKSVYQNSMKIYLRETSTEGFNAGSKARQDIDCQLETHGYSPRNITIFNPEIGSWTKKWKRIAEVIKIKNSVGTHDTVFLQLPYYTYKGRTWFFRLIFGEHRGKIISLIHDIPGYRDNKGLDEDMRYILSKSSCIIVHTPLMARKLASEHGIDSNKIRILNLFDYLTDDPVSEPNPDGKTIIFAGNLSQCSYLRHLGELPETLSFNIYGVHSDNVVESDQCHYKGKFRPDNVSAIEGDWGLVWHGDSINTSAGNIGEYLRIIASHKISLYLAAGKPVILWDESSVADFIIENHLGIAVPSLHDIAPRLAALTDEEKSLISKAVKTFAGKLRQGNMTSPLIEQSEKE